MSACARLSRIRQPPEKLRDRIAVARGRKAEARQQRRRAGAGGVAADLVEAVMQLRERLAAAARDRSWPRLGRGELALDFAQLAVAVQHELDRRRRDGWRLLRDVRDRPRGRQVDAPGIRVQLAEDQREEARLAGAVRPDEADLVAGVDGERSRRRAGAWRRGQGRDSRGAAYASHRSCSRSR